MRPSLPSVWALLWFAVVATGAEPVDQHGDPLPPGAVARLGTIRYRGPLGPGLEVDTMTTLRDNRVCVIDTKTGAIVRQLAGPDLTELEASDFSISSDGQLVAYYDAQRVEIWDTVEKRRLVATDLIRSPSWRMIAFNRATHPVHRIAFATGPMIAVVQPWGMRSPVTGWDLRAGRECWRYPKEDRGIQEPRLAGILPEQSQAVVIEGRGKDCKAVLIDLGTGAVAGRVALANLDEVAMLAISPEKRELAVLNDKGIVRRYTLPEGTELPAIATMQQVPFFRHMNDSMAYQPGGAMIAIASYNAVQILDTTTLKAKSLRSAAYKSLMEVSLKFSSDGKTLWVTDRSESAWQSCPADGERLQTHAMNLGHGGPVAAVAVSPKDGLVATRCPGDGLRLWDGTTGAAKGKLSNYRELFSLSEQQRSMAFHPGGRILAAFAAGGQIDRWDPNTRRPQSSFHDRSSIYGGAVAFSHHGKWLAIVPTREPNFGGARPSAPTHFRIVDAGTGKTIHTLSEQTDSGITAEFSADDQWLLTSSVPFMGEGTAATMIFHAPTGRTARVLPLVRSATFLPHGDLLALALPDGIVIDEMSSRDVRLRLALPEQFVPTSITASRDGRWLAAAGSGARARYIHLWDVRTGRRHGPLLGHQDAVLGVAFTPSGLLTSVSADSTGLVWDVARFGGPGVPSPASAAERDAAWAALVGNAETAHRAIESLVSSRSAAVELVRERLRPARRLNPEQVTALLGQLDSPSFAERRAALAQLESLDTQAEPYLAEEVRGSKSAEVRQRARVLLERLNGAVVDPERRRELRAVEVLRRIGTPEAIAVLNDLAQGDPAARLTRAARTRP